jgi:prepilin signal peptidase PulO-like enzyme (type II secretory pathway)
MILAAFALIGWIGAFLLAIQVERALNERFGADNRFLDYAVTGLVSAIGALLAFSAGAGWTGAACTGAALAALVVSARTDWRFGVIADLTSAIAACAALIGATRLNPQLSVIDISLGAALSIAILGLAAGYSYLRRRQTGIGSGDIILAGACGLWVGPVAAALALFAAATLTALIAIVKRVDPQARLPFAPGLAAGYTAAAVFGAAT